MRRTTTSLQVESLPLHKCLWLFMALVVPFFPRWVAPASAGCNFNPFCDPLFFFCCTLDTAGQGGSCKFECPITEVSFQGHTAGSLTSRYEVKGQSSYKVSGTAACPADVKKVKGVATWQQDRGKLDGIAKEEIFWEAPFAPGGWTLLVSTTSRCTANPWLSENAQCNVLSKDPASSTFPGPYPRSAKTMSEAMRQSLMFAAYSKEPPSVLSPEPNAVIADGKVVFVAHKFVPDHPSIGTPQIEVQFVIPAWPGMPGGELITKVVNLNNNSVTKLVELTPGSWLVKARVKSPAGDSPWSLQSNLQVPSSQTKKKAKTLQQQVMPMKHLGIKPDVSK